MSNSPAISIEIRPLEEDDIQAILQWNRNTDEDFLHQWSGYTAYHFPLTAEQIRKRRTLSSCRLFAALQEGKTVAAAEIDGLGTSDPFIFSNTLHQKEIHSQKSAHLCRLIVSNESKSKGIGSAFLHELCKTCFFEMGLSRLTLQVFCFNIGALRCYEKCGFLATSYDPGESGKKPAYTMELTKERFLQLFYLQKQPSFCLL